MYDVAGLLRLCVNLYKLYKTVDRYGGFDKVSRDDSWPFVVDEMGIPEECVNASEVLKHIYQR